MADLEAASVADVREFYQTYYVPENATLVLVGDFDTAQASKLVAQYLGRVPKAAHPVPRDIPKEPPQTTERRVTVQEPWPLPAVIVAYHVTFDGDRDSYPLHVAAKLLTDGESSRIYQKLVYEKQIAVAAFGQANLIEDPNLFYCTAIVGPGHTPDEAAAALIAELDRLRDEPVTEHELQRTKNQFVRDYILGRETDQGKALQLAHAVVIHNDITTADGEFDIFQNMTAADVQRVARTYFTPENRTVLTILPSERPGTGK
jgi:zinc protease